MNSTSETMAAPPPAPDMIAPPMASPQGGSSKSSSTGNYEMGDENWHYHEGYWYNYYSGHVVVAKKKGKSAHIMAKKDRTRKEQKHPMHEIARTWHIFV